MKFKSAIKAMYFMDRGTFDRIGYSNGYYKAFHDSDEFEIKLKEKLKDNKELLELFDKFYKASQDLDLENAYLHFAEGFRFGVIMGLDIAGYIKDEDILDGDE